MWKSMLLTCGCLLLSTLSGFADDEALQSALKSRG
jgi:hypothetical protein